MSPARSMNGREPRTWCGDGGGREGGGGWAVAAWRPRWLLVGVGRVGFERGEGKGARGQGRTRVRAYHADPANPIARRPDRRLEDDGHQVLGALGPLRVLKLLFEAVGSAVLAGDAVDGALRDEHEHEVRVVDGGARGVEHVAEQALRVEPAVKAARHEEVTHLKGEGRGARGESSG